MNEDAKLPSCLDNVVLPEELPPLVLTAFTRPDLLQDVLKAISQQSLLPSKIIAFIDGARKDDDKPLIKKCVLLLEEFSSSIPVRIVERTHNLGCDQNVILGFTEVLSSHESLVYLEDDDVPNPYFYDRMCRLLEAYRDYQQIASVSAYANFPDELEIPNDVDFIVSNRVFSWGFGTWFDRWQELDLVNQSDQYNPFGSFYKIPLTVQTKMTMINQFWLEKNQKTDWMITFTVASLYHQKTHIIPKTSFVLNIGFGHAQSKTYKGKEEAWVNAKYDENFYPNYLPTNLELPSHLKHSLSDNDLAQHFFKSKGLWLNPLAFLYLFRKVNDFSSKILLFKVFATRLPLMLQRWRGGLRI